MKNCEKNMDFSMFWKMFSSGAPSFLFCCKYKISLLMPKSLWYNVNEKKISFLQPLKETF